jgi:zinc and cadmium transporter
MNTLYFIIVGTVVTSFFSLIGIFFLRKTMRDKLSYYFISFAAGVMLTAAFVDILPEVQKEAKDLNVFLPVLGGIVVFFFIERFVIWFHHHDHSHSIKPSAILILLGDGLHNFFDGIAIAAAFLTNFGLGITTTLAILAHEIPHEIADFGVLINGGFSNSKALFFNFLSAITAILGGILGFYFLKDLQRFTPIALAFTAGTFVYIACSDLIPESHKDFSENRKWIQSISFVIGIITIYLAVKFIEH